MMDRIYTLTFFKEIDDINELIWCNYLLMSYYQSTNHKSVDIIHRFRSLKQYWQGEVSLCGNSYKPTDTKRRSFIMKFVKNFDGGMVQNGMKRTRV